MHQGYKLKGSTSALADRLELPQRKGLTQRASTNRLEAHQGVVKRPAVSTLEVHRCAHAGDCILDKHRLKAEDELLSYKMHFVITL